MKYVIRFHSLADGQQVFAKPLWLLAFDPEFKPPSCFAPYPNGNVQYTSRIEEAMQFDTSADAWALYRTVSKTVPLRPDGEPNRPMTAYTIIIDALQEKSAV